MKKSITHLFLLLSLFFITIAQAYDGKVIDSQTKQPIAGAVVTLGNEMARAGTDGTFHLGGTGEVLKLRFPGYARLDFPTAQLSAQNNTIALTPFTVKALYLSGYGVASHLLRNAALKTIKENNMNALVIDFKNDHGLLTFNADIPFAKEIGSDKKILIKDVPALMAVLKKENLYLIARIVTFKDDALAEAKPEWSVKKSGTVYRDREKLRWVDPFRQEIWDYNIAIAKAAAEMGFDEVQFDYVRFPDTKGVQFSQPTTMETRTKAITSFLEAAHKTLVPYNVMISADIFGYVAWNTNDTDIGQDINKITNAVDVVSLMLYPSGFQFGIPNYRDPIEHSYHVVHLSLKNAQKRTQASTLRFRPWLQAFRDYAFNKENFAEDKMRTQIKAATDFGSSGYMFWNPRNVYPKGQFDG